MNKKRKGVYYTPEILSNFLVKHIFEKYIFVKDLKILEPACGDGQFLSSILNSGVLKGKTNVRIDLVEINKAELQKASSLVNSKNSSHLSCKINAVNKDFLDFNPKSKYTLIIGNPPYINKKLLKKHQIKKCFDICTTSIPAFGETKNIWPAFLLQSINFLDENGVLCFVLPAELLQVNYTRSIRNYLLDIFDRIEIFMFDELIFDGIEQDVIAIIGVKNYKIKQEKGISFYQVDKLEDLKIPGYTEMHSNVHRERLDKWTNYLLSDEELNFIDDIAKRHKSINDYCLRAEVGIVTAANNFFIVPHSTVLNYKLEKIAKPIIKKGTVISDRIAISKTDFNILAKLGKAVYFLYFPEKEKDLLPKSYRLYIENGENEDLHKRYKMKLRNQWYHVPAVWASECLFLKRSHLYPRIITNDAVAYATDAFYRIDLKTEYDKCQFTFAFYNSLTLVLAELEGRFYGGGVLELIPSEFKRLKLPYNKNITVAEFNHLENLFKNKTEIESILDFTDKLLLPMLKPAELTRLRRIRLKLLNRRLKKRAISSNI